MNDVERLRKAIRDLHGLEATHIRTEPVHETFQGETVWDGEVEVFTVTGRPDVTHAYAWSHETDEGGQRYVAIVGVGPVKSASDAVRASIAAEHQGNARR